MSEDGNGNGNGNALVIYRIGRLAVWLTIVLGAILTLQTFVFASITDTKLERLRTYFLESKNFINRAEYDAMRAQLEAQRAAIEYYGRRFDEHLDQFRQGPGQLPRR